MLTLISRKRPDVASQIRTGYREMGLRWHKISDDMFDSSFTRVSSESCTFTIVRQRIKLVKIVFIIIQLNFLFKPTASALNLLNYHADAPGIHQSLLCLCFESDTVDDWDACWNSACNEIKQGLCKMWRYDDKVEHEGIAISHNTKHSPATHPWASIFGLAGRLKAKSFEIRGIKI